MVDFDQEDIFLRGARPIGRPEWSWGQPLRPEPIGLPAARPPQTPEVGTGSTCPSCGPTEIMTPAADDMELEEFDEWEGPSEEEEFLGNFSELTQETIRSVRLAQQYGPLIVHPDAPSFYFGAIPRLLLDEKEEIDPGREKIDPPDREKKDDKTGKPKKIDLPEDGTWVVGRDPRTNKPLYTGQIKVYINKNYFVQINGYNIDITGAYEGNLTCCIVQFNYAIIEAVLKHKAAHPFYTFRIPIYTPILMVGQEEIPFSSTTNTNKPRWNLDVLDKTRPSPCYTNYREAKPPVGLKGTYFDQPGSGFYYRNNILNYTIVANRNEKVKLLKNRGANLIGFVKKSIYHTYLVCKGVGPVYRFAWELNWEYYIKTKKESSPSFYFRRGESGRVYSFTERQRTRGRDEIPNPKPDYVRGWKE